MSSSKGGDGHTLALTEDGQLYSWGDGDYGKLGHGNCTTYKTPKLIKGPLADKVIKCMHAGMLFLSLYKFYGHILNIIINIKKQRWDMNL